MKVKFKLNSKPIEVEISPDTLLIDLLRDLSCFSVKRGCETSNCGLCTVLVDNKSILSCSYPAARLESKEVVTLEGLQEEAREFAKFMADQGGEQCGFCSPALVVNVLAMKNELKQVNEEEIKEYLAGNLCRCSGYEVQMRAIKAYLSKEGKYVN